MSDENPYAAPESDITPNESGELASRGIRLGGAVIDGLIAMLVMWPAMIAFGYWNRALAGEQGPMDTILLGGLGMVVFVLLHGFLLARSGQTIGKRILGTQIVSVADNRILPFWKVITYRYFPVWVLTLLPLIGMLFSIANPLFIFREDRRCIHDLIAGTKVVVARRP